jgi:uncharacterized 2Fe-2S/4Fe-4S cluster protein (DUF4445 family)
MGSGDIQVAFLPERQTRSIALGTSILEAANQSGSPLRADCGGNGTCGQCKVFLTFPPPEVSFDRLLAELAEENIASLEAVRELLQNRWSISMDEVLACRTFLEKQSIIFIPDPSRNPADSHILTQTEHLEPSTAKKSGQASSEKKPSACWSRMTLPPPSRQDPVPDLERCERELGIAPLKCSPEWMKRIPTLLRDSNWEVCCGVFLDELVSLTPKDDPGTDHALAIDLGTTTLAAKLVDLKTQMVVAVEAMRNPQMQFGDDILSRILEAGRGPASLEKLHETIMAATHEIVDRLCRQVAITADRIAAVAVAGNTAMQQIFCGADPQYLGTSPFVPVLRSVPLMKAKEVGLNLHPETMLYVFPVIGGFVGGDLVSGILSTKLNSIEGPSLLIDIGTNGEVILCHEGKWIAAATAAGPTFEGARIRHGMSASLGAIERCRMVEGDLSLQTIGRVKPVGICGSGLIDVAAELLRQGIVSNTGQLHPPENAPEALSERLRRRMIRLKNRPAFVLATEEESGRDGEPVLITQNDVRQLQLATGAIRAGVRLLLHQQAIPPESLQHVFLGGGFGNFLRRENAQRIGLLPWEIPVSRIQYRGNTSLAGALALLLHREACETVQNIARKTRHVDLSTCPEFQNFFADAMLFPEQ